jgi:AcrR family transcriptional regulator
MDMAPTATKTAPAPGERVPRADARRNRRKVLDAARKRFADDGLDAQIDDIARDAGVGVGTVYRHFPTKEDLLQALVDERFAYFAEVARGALTDPDPWNGFCTLMRESARVTAEDRAVSQAMDQLPGLCETSATKAGLREAGTELVDRAKASGQLRSDFRPEDIGPLMCGLGRAVGPRHADPMSMSWERYLDIMLAGLRTPAA